MIPKIKQLLKQDTYTVTWSDRNYKQYQKSFKDDPNGPPQNGLKKAKQYMSKLQKADQKSKDGLYRSISLA